VCGAEYIEFVFECSGGGLWEADFIAAERGDGGVSDERVFGVGECFDADGVAGDAESGGGAGGRGGGEAVAAVAAEF